MPQVGGGKGCLKALADAFTSEDGPNPVHPRVRAVAHAALTEFFKQIVGGDPVVRDSGDAAAVLAALDLRPFQSTSARFLAGYLAALLRLEDASISGLGRERLKQYALEKANRLVKAFERDFYGKPWNDLKQVGHVHLFRVIRGEPEWLARELRKKVAPT